MLRIDCWRAVVAVVLAAMLLALGGCGSDADVADTTATADTQDVAMQLPDFTTIVKNVGPAVVNISALPPEPSADAANGEAQEGEDSPDEQSFKHQLGPNSLPGLSEFMPHPSLGSGFIISADGYILTNRHVIRGAGRIVVKLSDRRQLLAEVVGADKYSDVALLKVDAEDLPTVAIGQPDQLEVGSWVLAIGSPFGFDTSVTAGIVSAKGRALSSEQYVPFIQTDVAINPGNSGGPLFNLQGQVVGINSQIYSRTGGYQGVSFAIPIDIAMDVAEQLKGGGTVERGWLGVQIQDVSRDMAQSFGLKWPRGALVARVFPDSPASGVGLHAGDVILKFNGQPVPSAAALPPLVGTLQPGADVPMLVLRDGNEEDFTVEIGALPEDVTALDGDADESAPQDAPARLESQGLTLEQLTAEQREQLGLGDNGVLVSAIRHGAGAEAGVQRGDIILAIGKHWLQSPPDFTAALANGDSPVALLIWRDGQRLYLAMHPS